jgi:hypothetical protein
MKLLNASKPKPMMPEFICLIRGYSQAAALAEALARDGVPTFRQKYGQMTFVLDQLVQELKGVLHGN